ncbi:MAG: N-acetyltransferase [Candidatus Krumholzibacteriota bacterium]|nr:N-acetyltransferase [Candidatus Krumholzibacteriota bacterium]
MTVRRAVLEDIKDITEIYNHSILNDVATFDTEPQTVAEREAWFRKHGPRHPVMVGELEGRVIGWAALSSYSERRAYADLAEISLYLERNYRGRGYGKRILEGILEEGKRAGLHSLVARITDGNETSIHLFSEAGFVPVGILKEAGRKFGRLLDVHIMQKIYEAEK